MSNTKTCSRCGENLPATREYFYGDKRASDGLYGHCKECHGFYGKRHYQNNREDILSWQREYYEKNPDHRKETLKRYYQNNREKVLERTRKQEKTPNAKQRKREYRRKNLDRYRIHAQNRLTRKAGFLDDFTPEDWQHAVDYFNGRCAVCERPPGFWHKLAMDHWIPISDPNCPGTIPSNIVPLCHGIGGCNNSKHNNDPHEWLVKKFGTKKARAISDRIHKYFSSVRKT